MPDIDLKITPLMIKVTLESVPDRPGVAAEVFSFLGEQGINVELLSTIPTSRGKGDISFAVPEQDLAQMSKLLESLKSRVGARKVITTTGASLISLYGEGLSTDPSLSSKIFKTLAGDGINIQMISQSVNAVSFLIDRAKLDRTRSILQSLNIVED